MLFLISVAMAQDTPAPQVWLQMEAITQEKDSWTPTQTKIESQLLMESKRHLGHPFAPGMPALRLGIVVDAEGLT